MSSVDDARLAMAEANTELKNGNLESAEKRLCKALSDVRRAMNGGGNE